ncbi:MAG: hypothetical protein SGJ10_00945 [Bacteroidota bacterium]|nr:hypothetical protein [Bacteroidota bacterium]
MNIFKPYTIIEESKTSLHLGLSSASKITSILTYRVLRLFLMVMLLGVVYFAAGMPTKIYIGLAVIFIVAVFMLFANIPSDIYFGAHGLEIRDFKTFNTISKTYILQDKSHINLAIYRGWRSAGAYYKFVLRDNKKITLFNLPIVISFDKEKFRQVNQKLTRLTHLKIEDDLEKME